MGKIDLSLDDVILLSAALDHTLYATRAELRRCRKGSKEEQYAADIARRLQLLRSRMPVPE